MQIYLVGGAVRDSLLNLPITERDWVVVGATPEKLINQGYQQVGNHFPVFLHPTTHEEYALARTECKTGHGYQGFSFQFAPYITLEEDLLRRDLTINAMAMDDKGKIIDPHHGQADLKLKLLRHVSNAFIEDPLRVLRVARFYARFYHLGFQVAPETMELMQKIVSSNELSFLSSERIWMEWTKALLTNHPEQFVQCLKDCGALSSLAPELLEINLTTFASQLKPEQSIAVRFSLLSHDLTEISFQNLAKRLKVPKHFLELGTRFIKNKSTISHLISKSPEQILALLQNLDAFRQQALTEDFLECAQALKLISPKEKLSMLTLINKCKDIKLHPELQGSKDVAAIQGYFKQQRLALISDMKTHLSS